MTTRKIWKLRGLDASFLLDKGDADAAIAELQPVAKEAPDNFIAGFNLGRAWFARGNLDAARRQFEAVLKIRPDYEPARLALGRNSRSAREISMPP